MKFFSQMNQRRGAKLLFAGLLTSLALGGSAMYSKVSASDHDDGETNIKSRNLNLTDLYAFRKDSETGVAGDASNLILIMNTNPRSLPRQQYFFNTNAFYNFHISRRTSATQPVSGVEDIRFEFSFQPPDANGKQAAYVQVHTFNNGVAAATQTFANAGYTTPAPALLSNSASAPTVNPIQVAPLANANSPATTTVNFFAGLREDPFFFDVEQFFKVRASIAANGGAPSFGFNSVATAQDFAKGYNVNAIVADIPISLLKSANNETVFDIWETITVPSTTAALQ